MTRSEHNKQSQRTPTQHNEVINRSKHVTFTWNGKTYTVYEGDTIVSALAAAGERVFSRSMKLIIPLCVLTRSLLDPCSNVHGNDEPIVRGADRIIEEGMNIRSENTVPSVNYDIRAINQLGSRFLGPGFYYKTFIKPDFLRSMYQ